MSPWPRHIHGVTDHAVIRFFERARVKGYDNSSVAEWIKANRHRHDGESDLLKLLEASGVVVGYFRKVIQDECDANKRSAKLMEDGKFLIRGASAPYVVSTSGYVLTTLSRRYILDVVWPLLRQRAMVGA